MLLVTFGNGFRVPTGGSVSGQPPTFRSHQQRTDVEKTMKAVPQDPLLPAYQKDHDDTFSPFS